MSKKQCEKGITPLGVIILIILLVGLLDFLLEKVHWQKLFN